MKLIVACIILTYFILIWRLLYRWTLSKDYGKFLGHVIGFVGGNVFAVVIAIPMLPKQDGDMSFWGFIYGVFILGVLINLSFKRPTSPLLRSTRNASPVLQRQPKKALQESSSPLSRGPAVNGSIQVEYRNAEGSLSSRRIDVKTVNGNTFNGYCHSRGALRTFRIDRIEGDVIDLQTGEVLNPSEFFKH